MTTSHSIIFLNNYTGTIGSSIYDWYGGHGTFIVAASNFSTATVKLQVLAPDNVTWIDIGNTTNFTASGYADFYLSPARLQVAVTGGTVTGLYANAARIIY
jgi:hypothetical protein